MAVILTGMGNDGTLGMRLLKRHACLTIAQDEATCVVNGMPRAAIDAGVVDQVLAPAGYRWSHHRGSHRTSCMTTTMLTADEMCAWASYIHEATGILLDASKGYLIETRLGSLLREAGARSYGELLQKARTDASQGLRRKIIGAVTTHETSFFRDTSPFDLLRHKLLPELIDTRTHGQRATAANPRLVRRPVRPARRSTASAWFFARCSAI